MKCPVCLEKMECRSPIIKKVLADFHCFNDKCDSIKTSYRPHIGVVLSKDGKAPARCISYHLPFKEMWEDNWFIVEGSEVNKETTLFERYSFLMSDKKFDDNKNTAGKEKIETIWDMEMIVTVNKFLRFPIGEFTQFRAKDVYRTLTALELYTDYSYNSGGYYNNGYASYGGSPTYHQHQDSGKPTSDVPSITPQALGELAQIGYYGFWD